MMAVLQEKLNGSLFSQMLAVKYTTWSMKLLFKKHCSLQRGDSKFLLCKIFSTGIIVNIYDTGSSQLFTQQIFIKTVPDIMFQSWAR